MKVLIAFTCALAVAKAGWIPIQAGYKGPQHVPVIHDGVPTETPEVQHAKAAHFAALAEASSRPGYKAIEPQQHEEYNYNNEGHADQGHAYYSHAEHNTPAPVYYAPEPVHHEEHKYVSKVPFHPAYETTHVLPAIDHSGKPLDTPEVEEAKHDHFVAFSQALASTAPHKPEEHQHNYNGQDVYYRQRRSIYAAPIINEHGVPVEPIEVQNARSAHLAAHHAPAHGYSTVQVHDPVYGVHYDHWTPKYDHYGHPLDIDEVEHAKQAHFHAHKTPAVGPIDTAEVAHAKAEHLAAHSAIKVYHY